MSLQDITTSFIFGCSESLFNPYYLPGVIKRESQEIRQNGSIRTSPEDVGEFVGYLATAGYCLDFITRNPTNLLSYVPLATNLLIIPAATLISLNKKGERLD